MKTETPTEELTVATVEMPVAPPAMPANPIPRLVDAMKKIAALGDERAIPDCEVAAFIVRLHDKKGEAALNSFLERALGPEKDFKLLGYERAILREAAKSQNDSIERLNRRKWMATTGEVGAGLGLAVAIASPLIPHAVNQMDSVKAAQRNKRMQQEQRLAQFIQENPVSNRSTLDEINQFYEEVDRRVVEMIPAQPAEQPPYARVGAIIGATIGLIFSDRIRCQASTELGELYHDTARYIARRAGRVMERELEQAMGQPQAAPL